MADIAGVFAELNTKLRNFKQAWAAEFTERVQKKHVKNEGEYTMYAGLSGTFAVGGYDTGHMSRSWGITYKATDLEIYNTQPYASFVEYGVPPHIRTSAWGKPTAPYLHPGMPPQGQLRSTMMEKEQITDAAKKKVGL